MSHKVVLGVEIKASNFCHLQTVCERLGLLFDENRLTITGTNGRSISLIQQENGGYKLRIDTDRNYSELGSVIGYYGEKLLQGYAEECAQEVAERSGWRIEDRTVNADGSISLSIAV
jgi:hypothetical protein